MRTEVITITQKIEKSDEKTFFKLPFDLPDGVDKIDVRYSYKGDFVNAEPTFAKNVIDLAFLGKNGEDLGTRGSDIHSFKVSSYDSDPGFKLIELTAGRYYVVLGAYLIKPEGVQVTVTVTVYFKERRFFKGDLHCHTSNSDGKYTATELALKAKRNGLDFVAITDHNNNLKGVAIPRIPNFLVLEGLELTNYKGHIGLLGVVEPYKTSFAVTKDEDLVSLIEESHNNGAIVCLNHPVCSFCPIKLDLEGLAFDAIEVWNGFMRVDNLNAVALWDSYLKAGKKVVAFAGSDYHKAMRNVVPTFARPTVYVLADSLSKTDLLKALREGRLTFSASRKSLFLDITATGGAVMGDTVKITKDTTLTVTASSLKRGQTLNLVGKNGIVFSHTAKRRGSFSATVPVTEAGYLRAEVTFNKKPIARLLHKLVFTTILHIEPNGKLPRFYKALTNPIYFE